MAAKSQNQQIGENVRRLRGDMSQEELATRLRRYGYKWSKATVWAIENGSRPLKLTEAQDLMEVFGMTAKGAVSELFRSGPSLQLDKIVENIPEDMAQLTRISHNFWWAHEELKKILDTKDQSVSLEDKRAAERYFQFTDVKEILKVAAAQMYYEIADIQLKKKKQIPSIETQAREPAHTHARYDSEVLDDLATVINDAELRDYLTRFSMEVKQRENGKSDGVD